MKLETRLREFEQESAQAMERELAVMNRSAQLDARESELNKRQPAGSESSPDLESLQAAVEAERTAWDRERRQLTSDKTAAETALKQAERRAKSLEAEYRELSQRQKFLERDRENLRRQKDETVIVSTTSPDFDKIDEPAAPTRAMPGQQTPTAAAPPVAPANRPAVPAAASHGHVDDATDSDSVAAYMQRLMARNRQGNEGEARWTASEKPKPAITAPVAAPEEPLEAAPAPQFVETPSPTIVPTPLPGPSHTQDKATVRADLDSLRNIANSAARSAIAQYTTKSTREKLFFRGLLLTLSLVAAVVLLTSSIWGDGGYLAIGWCALVTSGALCADILLRAKAMRSDRRRPAAPAKRQSEGNPVENDKSPR